MAENNLQVNYGGDLFAFFGRAGFRIYIQVTDRSLCNTWYTSTLSIWCLVRLNGIGWRSMASCGAKGNANVFVMLPGQFVRRWRLESMTRCVELLHHLKISLELGLTFDRSTRDAVQRLLLSLGCRWLWKFISL